MLLKTILPRFTSIQTKRTLSVTAQRASKPLEAAEENPILDETTTIEERKIGRLNVSRLCPQHRNILHGTPPYEEPHSWVHETESFKRKMFGRYGAKSGVNPKICFPTKEDEGKQARYEAVAHPLTLQQMMKIVEENNQKKIESIQKREENIAQKIEKLDKWKQELDDKIAKKEADALAAKIRKERMIEEVRRHFGFNVDPRDERFKELLEQKEKEDKKKQKEARRKAKEEKMMAKLLQKSADNVEKVPE